MAVDKPGDRATAPLGEHRKDSWMKQTAEAFGRFQYAAFFPEDFSPEAPCPLLIFLHGAGTRGTDLNEHLRHSAFFSPVNAWRTRRWMVAAPQCFGDSWFDVFEQLCALVEHLRQLPGVDPARVYLMGNSMGGYGVWQLAMSHPEWFAAAVPICGGGMYWNAGRLRDVAVWAFHGGQDGLVLPRESEKMVQAAVAAGCNARLTVYPNRMHDSWSDTYRSQLVCDWLLAQRKRQASLPGRCCTGHQFG